MKHLLYCILREPAARAAALPAGVDGSAVFLMGEAGLAAACSVVSEECLAPSVPRAMAFARVVEALHGSGPVVPFRYGCFLDSEAQVSELVRVRRLGLEASLDAVEGCVEMSLRVLLEKKGSGVSSAAEKAPNAFSSGHAYLADRRKHYAVLDAAETEADTAADELRQALAGHFVKAEVERPRGSGAPLLSLHFLVLRERVPSFREAFQAAQRDRPERMLLTGPWPPYNFVESA